MEVKAILQADSTFLATRIKVEDENYQHIEITAAIDTIYDHTVVVAGIEFQTDSNTVILDENHDPITINDLEIGMIVEVYGILLDDGSYYATKIEVEDLWSNTVEFEGTLDAISDTMGQVGNWQFYIDAATVIISESGDTVDVTYLTVGMHVEVRAEVQSDSSLLATRIKVDSPGDAAIIGTINGITGNSLVMGNLNIELNNVTFITDLANRQTDFTELETGLVVKAKVTQLQNGVYVASRIKISENPNVVKSTGTVITVGPDFIVISQPSYQINSETIVLTSDYKPMDYSNIHPGDEVTVWADVSAAGDPLALQIKKSADTVTNSDDGSLSVVKEYTLYQNFPNPFNPSTTIRFTLPQEAFVTLKVYNIVGEEVATLVNNNLTQGMHSVQFNASNLASGVYLYRLQVNTPGTGSGAGFVQVKKMLLIK